MKPPARVIWSEGLLMTPQHMQHLDRFHEERLNARLGALVQELLKHKDESASR